LEIGFATKKSLVVLVPEVSDIDPRAIGLGHWLIEWARGQNLLLVYITIAALDLLEDLKCGGGLLFSGTPISI
jgi:hypothetical protein